MNQQIPLPVRLYLRLDEKSRHVLPILAAQDYRNPGQQIDYLIQEEARRRGILPEKGNSGGHASQAPTATVEANPNTRSEGAPQC